jgi:hypothetical protein
MKFRRGLSCILKSIGTLYSMPIPTSLNANYFFHTSPNTGITQQWADKIAAHFFS